MPIKVEIKSRFCGPDNSGNGGYCCGVLASHIEGAAQVRLHSPPPLNVPLEITQSEEGWHMNYQETRVASAIPHTLSNEPIPDAPSLKQARLAREEYAGYSNHSYPHCFVCGPAREPGDGLCLFTGPVKGSDLVACDWQPAMDMVDVQGIVKTEFVWSVLDCPGFFALREPLHKDNLFLLGQLTAEIVQPVPADKPLIVYAWKRYVDGRKYFSGSAVSTAEGELLARSEQVWIRLQH